MKLIKKSFGSYIETDDESIITEAEKEGLEITEILPNPNNYKPDDSDRPEVIAEKARIQSQQTAQAKVDNEINKPNLLESLKKLPYQEKSEKERNLMAYTDLVQYHSLMVQKQNLVEEAKEMGIDAEKLTTIEILEKISEEKAKQENTL